MTARNSFNGGELSPSMQMRVDMDVFQRGCSCVENFDIGQTGSVRRRRGFRKFAEAQGESSRLFAYKYRNDTRYLVEVGTQFLRVYSTDGTLVWETTSSYTAECMPSLRTLQINSVLLFTDTYLPPMQLVCDSSGEWRFELYPFKVPPWRYSEYRDHAVVVSRRSDGYYNVAFDVGEDVQEATPSTGEVLRVSFYTEAAEIKQSNATLFNRVTSHHEEGFISAETQVAKGAIIAVRRAPEYAVWSCVKAFDASTMFISGLIDPANYTGNFQISSDTTAYDQSIAELTNSTSFTQGQRVRFEQGYWDLFTCIADFDGARDFFSEGINPEDYPGHFVRGIMLGSAPCKGKWNFYPSGTWYGSYEVRASYEGQDADSDWEYRGEAFSRNIAPSNSPLAGDESDEECYVSLWLTRVRAYGESWSARNFPADSCGNVLTVSSYKHDLVLKYQEVWDSEAQVAVDAYYILMDAVKTDWYGSITSIDWSWCAFSRKYGFPRLACIFNQRLVFAGTESQPQTIWLSQVDNIDNFDIITSESGGMALTMSSQTQDAIRWMASQNSRIMLGTAEGEYVIQSGSSGVMTYANATIVTHGFVGAAEVEAVQASDKIIYFERGGGRAMQHGYDYAQDAYISSDLTVFAEHILKDGGGVKEGCFLRKPDAKAVMVLQNGQLALMTYNSMHQVNAWHRYTTDGSFLSVAMLPNGNAADSLFAVVRREDVREVADDELVDPGDKVTRYYIERMDDSCSWVDNGDRDYTSTLLTNALMSTQVGSSLKGEPQIAVYIMEPCPVRGVEFSVDGGEHWSVPSLYGYKSFPAGWHHDAAFAKYKYDRAVGFRVRGNRDFCVLGLQG